MRSEEVDHAQNPDRSKEGIGSKLLNGTICPKPSSVSGPLMLVKRLCLIQESRINHSWKREEEISYQLYLIFFSFFFFLKLATALVPLYMREGEGIVDACH